MDDLLDMIIADESPSQISDALKDVLYAKSSASLVRIKSKLKMKNLKPPMVSNL
jgi:hypothetical protein